MRKGLRVVKQIVQDRHWGIGRAEIKDKMIIVSTSQVEQIVTVANLLEHWAK